MNKAELIQAVVEANEMTKVAATRVVDAVFSAITDALRSGDEVVLPGFGKFSVEQRAERIGRNPKTGAPLQIPAMQYVKFKAGKALKDEVQEVEAV